MASSVLRACVVLPMLVGCSVNAERGLEGSVSADDVAHLEVTLDRGSLDLEGVGDDVVWSARSAASGADEDKAIANEAGNSVIPSFEEAGSEFNLTLEGVVDSGSMDLSVTAPAALDVTATADNGNLSMTGFEGSVVGSGNAVSATSLVGSADLTSTGRMDVSITPRGKGASVVLTAGGNTVLKLPRDGDYDIHATINSSQGKLDIEDFGFADYTLDGASFSAVLGRGTHKIDVTVSAGSFSLRSFE